MNSDYDADISENRVEYIDVNSEDQGIYTPPTAADIEEILKFANIDSNEIAPIVQHLYSHAEIDKECTEYKILELDDHLLQALKSGDSISFRGEPEEEAVLCTSNRTYEVKEAETSNTCLLVPKLKLKDEVFVEGLTEKIVEEVEVVGAFKSYLEVRECSPRLSKLQLILEPSSFKGLEYEKNIDQSSLYDWERLRNEIQASDGEILDAFPKFLIVEMNGYYRLIAFEFEARALPMMLDLIEENSWAIDEIDKKESYDALKDIIPESVFECLFYAYTELSSKTKQDGSLLYKFDEAKTSRLLAKILLESVPVNNYDDFMEAWKIGSPDCILPKEEYLYGCAIVVQHKQTLRKQVISYPEANLPNNLIKRLKELFKVKDKWTVPEIAPYIEKFATRNQDVNAILTKYARVSTINNIKYYSAKHGK
ncbi:sister chromatid cohesion protein DCC1 [Phymastichus coffea]|uniref:sister chromatid cohesion protein DCC1 n=1 Tax=Phymastichus coffea TaxID=108790 RepID=UPI00273C751F|nr:sister chromatid cohesion protein DCC1 [Phymastichus coffea]